VSKVYRGVKRSRVIAVIARNRKGKAQGKSQGILPQRSRVAVIGKPEEIG
jgi:hypothetical protein